VAETGAAVEDRKDIWIRTGRERYSFHNEDQTLRGLEIFSQE